MRRWEQPAAACVLQAWGSTTSVQLKTDFFSAAAAGHVQRLQLELRARGIAPALQGESDACLLWAALQVRWVALGQAATMPQIWFALAHLCPCHLAAAAVTWAHTDQ